MQRVAYPYTMLMIMIMKVFSLLSTFFVVLVLVEVLHYLDSSLSPEAVEYGVPCSLAKELEQTM